MRRASSIIVLIALLLTIFATPVHVSLAAEKTTSPKTPIIVTTCGQSPGALMFKLVCDRAKLPCEQNDLLTAKDLKDKAAKDQGYKTLVITMGTSMKGMGAAGTDINGDVARIKALIQEAKKQGITVIGAHIEGMARRVDNMDQLSIDTVAPVYDILVVTANSDEDGYFTKLANQKKIRLVKVKETIELVNVLKTLFNQ
jgi:hypothetical protein